MKPEMKEALGVKILELDKYFRRKDGETSDLIFDKRTLKKISLVRGEIIGLKNFGTSGYPIEQIEFKITNLYDKIDELFKLGKSPEINPYSSTGE